MTVAAAAGQANITVASSAGFAVGVTINVGTGANVETRAITVIAPGPPVVLTVNSNLTNGHAIGDLVSGKNWLDIIRPDLAPEGGTTVAAPYPVNQITVANAAGFAVNTPIWVGVLNNPLAVPPTAHYVCIVVTNLRNWLGP